MAAAPLARDQFDAVFGAARGRPDVDHALTRDRHDSAAVEILRLAETYSYPATKLLSDKVEADPTLLAFETPYGQPGERTLGRFIAARHLMHCYEVSRSALYTLHRALHLPQVGQLAYEDAFTTVLLDHTWRIEELLAAGGENLADRAHARAQWLVQETFAHTAGDALYAVPAHLPAEFYAVPGVNLATMSQGDWREVARLAYHLEHDRERENSQETTAALTTDMVDWFVGALDRPDFDEMERLP